MKPSLAIALLLLVLIPLGLIAWLGLRVAEGERERLADDFRDLNLTQLAGLADSIASRLAEREADLLLALDKVQIQPGTDGAIYDPDRLRRIARQTPGVRAVFVTDWNGELIFPAVNATDSRGTAFLERSATVWESGERPWLKPNLSALPQPQSANQAPNWNIEQGNYLTRDYGWHTWFYSRGVHLLLWKQLPSGMGAVGLEVDAPHLLADIIGVLPDAGVAERVAASQSRQTRTLPALSPSSIRLVDASGTVLYQWGTPSSNDDENFPGQQLASLSVAPPLGMWRLEKLGELPTGNSGSSLFNILAGLSAAAIALVLLALYLYRQHSQQMHEAGQRVSFVNQVSHELKTPLTNIRMYAELLERRLPDNDPEAAGYADFVVSESQRLSRLITNVLTFARSGRGQIQIRHRVGCLDDVVRSTIDSFRPALTEAGVAEIQCDLDAREPVSFDPDIVEQVLANLIGNVEKYAAEGGYLEVKTSQDTERNFAVILITDRGPGIEPHDAELVFTPFERLDSNKLTSTASGAGIGLSIARDLARLHGGDLVLRNQRIEPSGATFEVTLETSS